jgi:hypothetical protein
MNEIVRKTTNVTLRRKHSVDQHRSLSWDGFSPSLEALKMR